MAKALGKGGTQFRSSVAGGAGRRSRPTWLDHLCLTASRPCQGPGLPRAPAPVATSGALPCRMGRVPPRTRFPSIAATGCVGLWSLLPGGPGAGVVLKTRDWRSYQTTGFPEEGRVGVGLRMGRLLWACLAWWRAHTLPIPREGRTVSPQGTPALPRTNTPQKRERPDRWGSSARNP